MSVSNKVIWSEGMFLRPQHFQQQDRYLERYIEGRTNALNAYFSGLQALAIDAEPLQLGKISITAARGVFPDGTPFSIPDHENLPPVLEVPENTREETVYLCIPLRRPGSLDVIRAEDSQLHAHQARFQAHSLDARDSASAAGEEARIQIGKLRLALKLGTDDLSGYATIGVARIRERNPDKPVELDNNYIPPLLDCAESPVLKAYFEELKSLLKQRGEALSHRLSDSGRAGSAEIADYMLLQVINRIEPLVAHLSQQKGLHPVAFFTELVQMAGELATFTTGDKRAPVFAPYQHDNLADTFAGIFAVLRQCLSMVLEQSAIAMKLVERKYGIHVAAITDPSLVTDASFVLAAKADMQGDLLRSHMPTQTKVAPVEKIRDLISAQLPGVKLRPLPVAPRQIPYHAGFTYFELERSGEIWNMMKSSGGFAIHLGADFPNLEMELWAIRD
ncbi:type VI secretion system baseplate subunit TssK [Exilibacterium tricleocarpae]|uniref:Type VI secretion system baseplate subunit TssK n=1 Tax=Exilibacterium tricleocarpae TaxID=2591008 RepID=A0A545SPN3_9GAMM|nr:type VI secretion system baseplate subunit TssK [Exilibacterium tricleocarpae]TQV66907.1 type VI secretion system baseplate subunit TssK [Exilibacterium tricleocarpae]